jgi:hypothetical protein
MQHHSRRRVTALVALPTALVLAGCGATNAPLKIGVRDVATTLLLGSGGKATVQAPVPPVVLPVHNPKPETTPPPVVFTPPPTVSATPTTAPPAPSSSAPSSSPTDQCPAGDPLAVPALPAPSTVQFQPVAAGYQQYLSGQVKKGAASVDLPDTARWSIGAPHSDWTGSFTFEQSEQIGSTTTVTTYRVVPQHNAAPAQLSGADMVPGIYLLSVRSTGTPTFRAPDPGLELAAFPLLPNGTTHQSATDGTRTMSFTATVKGLTTVNACGTPLAAWQVDLTDGEITDSSVAGADGTQQFTASYELGTQFGGIVLASSSKVVGSDAGTPVTRTVVTQPATAPKVGIAGLALPCAPPANPAPTGTAPATPTGSLPAAPLDYRSLGVVQLGTTNRTRLPWDATWQVTPAADGSYTVHRKTADGSTTTTYLIVPVGSSGPTAPGMYLESFPVGDGTFTAPAPGLQLAAFPLTAGARVTNAPATDGTATVSFNAVVGGPTAVGTCDAHSLDAWEIDLTGGTFTDPATLTSIKFDGNLLIGTQVGGLVLSQFMEGIGTTGVPAAPVTGSPGTTDSPAPSPSGTSGSSLVPTRYQFESIDTINANPAG